MRQNVHFSAICASIEKLILYGKKQFEQFFLEFFNQNLLYGKNFPDQTSLTRSPAGSFSRSILMEKSIALMMPSPNSSWIISFSAGPYTPNACEHYCSIGIQFNNVSVIVLEIISMRCV